MEASKKWHKEINVWIAIFSLLVAILSIAIQLRTKSRELTCNVISSSELTAVSKASALSATFTYEGKPVTHLWKISLLLVNSGNETLIGEGQHSTLINDGIVLGFSNQVKILNVESSDEEHISRIERPGPNVFKIKFSQWLPEEKVGVIIYTTSTSDFSQPIMPSSLSRDIVDGKVIVKNVALSLPSKTTASIDRFPAILRIPTKAMMATLALAFMFLGFGAAPLGIWQFNRLTKWKKRNLDLFEDYLTAKKQKNSFEMPDFLFKRYLSKPQKLPSDLWKDFPGEKLLARDAFDFDFDSWSQTIGMSLFMAFLGFLGAVYIFSILADIFPNLAS